VYGRNFRAGRDVLAPTADRIGHQQESSLPRRSLVRALLIAGSLLVGLGAATPVAAVDGLTIEAKAMLDGHARVGSWMAIAVHVKNDGPAIDGELRMAGGSQGRTRFGVPAPLPTQSDKTFLLYAQPPAFGRELEISLVDHGETILKTKVSFTVHDPTQLVVGVVAERPGDIVGAIDLLPNQAQVAPVILPLDPEDLPSRVEAWGPIDRLIWQDIDSNRLDTDQLAALRGWIAGGGRLVIVGGTAGPNTLSAFSDTLLPFRPIATLEVAADALSALVGSVPVGTADLPAMSGELIAGRTLLASGDRVIAADRPYGNGNTTLIGFDPTTKWIADGVAGETLWRRVIPTRTSSGLVLGDDSQLISAVSQLPSLALPPIGGLIALLAGYILLVGPINYFVLKRLDRREWAWVTMPLLVAVFAVGAYVYGAALRGSDVLVNEVALVRGSPGATDGTAQVYIGVFSPSRGTYQVEVPGGALLSSPISGDFFGGEGTASTLDVVQSDPARVRDLAVGFGSLRTIRAETPMAVPLVETAIRLEDGHLKGTVKNASQITLESPSVVLGSTVARLKDIAPGETVEFDEVVAQVLFGQQLSDRVVGPISFGDDGQFTADMNDKYIRHTIIDQLTYDPMWGSTVGLNTDGPVLLAWGSGSLLPVDVVGQKPRATGNILYYLPSELGIQGKTTFRGDLIRSTVLDSDAPNFSKDPYSMYFGQGSVALAYTPLPFTGSLEPTDLTFGLSFGGDQPLRGDGKSIEPLDAIPPSCSAEENDEACAVAGFDGMPEVEFFDRTAGEWVRLPHLTVGERYRLDDAARYVDPEAGTVLVRFVNDRSDGVGFMFDLAIDGVIR
jgi:hypothetical protein